MEDLPIWIKLVAVIFFVLLNGFFVSAEFSIVKIRTSRLETLVKAGNTKARYAKMLTDHLDAALSVTQLGITLASLGLGWIGEPAIATLIQPLMHFLGIGEVAAHTISLATAFSIITALHIILGELAPKSMAIQNTESVVLNISIPMLIFQWIFYPFVWILNHIANWLVKVLGFTHQDAASLAHTGEELRILMEESHRQGFINQTEYSFVDNVFDFVDKDVKDIMTPRPDMICVDLTNSIDENLALMLEEGLTRYPIFREGKDDILGFLHIKDLFAPLSKGIKITNLRRYARNVLFVPEQMAVSRLLKTMQQSHIQLAIVVDEYGGTSGMVTIEDILEEIVGEIQDEFDQERPAVERKGSLLYSVEAKLPLDELNDILEIHLTAENIDTIGGWLYKELETTPKVGDKAYFDGNEFCVEEVEKFRITRILVKLREELREEHEEIS